MELRGFEDLVEIGRGGFAVVYRAHQQALGRSVAIKVLTTPGLSDADRRRFDREGIAMGQLSWHPNIVLVHHTGVTDDGQPFLVMEYHEAGSLGRILEERGPLPAIEVLDHGVRLSGALETAHRAGLLHRDVKPDNVLLDAFGRVKLGDFGIAAVTGHTITSAGMLTATLAHAAPEVLDGERASPASDVYSLGSTLYELLSGTPAFVRPTDESIAALIARATSEPPPDLRPGGVPGPLVDIVEMAMAKAPLTRPSTAGALGEALQEAQRTLGLPVTELPIRRDAAPAPPPVVEPSTDEPREATISLGSAPVPNVPTPTAKRRRRRVLVGAVGVLVLVAVGLAVVLLDDDPAPDDASGAGTASGEDGGAGSAAGASDSVSIPVGDLPQELTSTEDGVWVTNGEGDTVSRIDPATNEIVATTPAPGFPEGIDISGNDIWVTARQDHTVHRIDATSNEIVATIPVGGQPRAVAATDAAVWVTRREGASVSRIDPATNEVVDVIDVGVDPLGVAAGDTAVWVTNRGDGTVSRIDPVTNEVADVISVGGVPRDVAVTETAVWVTDRDGDTVTRIDPVTNEVVATVDLDAPTWAVVATDDVVWITNREADTITRIDPATDEVVETVDGGVSPLGITMTADALWVSNPDEDVVIQVATS